MAIWGMLNLDKVSLCVNYICLDVVLFGSYQRLVCVGVRRPRGGIAINALTCKIIVVLKLELRSKPNLCQLACTFMV